MHRSNLDYSDLALEAEQHAELEGNFSLLKWEVAFIDGHPGVLRLRRNLDEALEGIERAQAAMIPEARWRAVVHWSSCTSERFGS